MFKKLKEKITEEVKSSPQRFAEFTQSVSDKLQSNSSADENFFSIGEDGDVSTPVNSAEQGFSSVALVSPSQERPRRNSNSSLASDISFLPRYEPGSMYHLQSDLDVSASEIEDNASTTSSQIGHLSKEQIYSAFQKSQMRYHKYRGRYTDLARHYQELERENGKMKSVLVETQDKAIRRVTELKEQCALEQKAKAHLEAALRDEIDEKDFKIHSLQTKIELLQGADNTDLLVHIDGKESSQTENLENLTKYLNDARKEIETLNERLQEMKANSIVFQSKEQEYKAKITNLEKEITQYSEREKENNLNLAQNKMELHNEIISKDTEISNLKNDNEALKQKLQTIEGENKMNGGVKMENLQSQNKKLIDKMESLTQKCNNLENELLKVEKYKLEIRQLNEELLSSKKVNEERNNLLKIVENLKQGLAACKNNLDLLSKENSDLKVNLTKERKEFENQIFSIREDAKKGLLSLEPKIRDKLQNEYLQREENLKREFYQKVQELSSKNKNERDIQMQLFDQEDQIKKLTAELQAIQKKFSKKVDDYNNLERSHLELIEDCSGLRNNIERLEKENSSMENYEEKIGRLEAHISTLQEELKELEAISEKKEKENVYLCQENLNLQTNIEKITERLRVFEEKYEAIKLDSSESKLLEMKVEKLDEEKKYLMDEFETERKMYNAMLQDHRDLKEKEQVIEEMRISLNKIRHEMNHINENLTLERDKNVHLYDKKHNLELEVEKLREKLRIMEEKDEASNMDGSECGILKLKLQTLEEENKKLRESFEYERLTFANELDDIKQDLTTKELSDLVKADTVDQESVEKLRGKLHDIRRLSEHKETDNIFLAEENMTLQQENTKMAERLRVLEEKLESVQLDSTESKLLELKVQQLEEENENMCKDFELERKMFNNLLENDKELKVKEEIIEQIQEDLRDRHREIIRLQETVEAEQEENIRISKKKLSLEKEVEKLTEKVRIAEEREEAVALDKSEAKLLEMKLEKLEVENRSLQESFEKERGVFDKFYEENSKNEAKISELVEENAVITQMIQKEKQSHEKQKKVLEEHQENLKKMKELEGRIEILQDKLKNSVGENEVNAKKLEEIIYENEQLKKEVEEKDSQVSELSKNITKLSEVIQKQTKEFNNLLERTQQLESVLEKIQVDSADAIKKEKERQNELTSKVEELQRELNEKTDKFAGLNQKLTELEISYVEEKRNYEEKISEIDVLRKKIVELQALEHSYRAIGQEKQVVDQELVRLKIVESEFRALQNEKATLENRFKQVENEFKAKNNELRVTEQSCSILKEEKDSLLEEIRGLRGKIEELSADNGHLRAASSRTVDCEYALEQLKNQNEVLQNENDSLSKEISEMNLRISQISSDNRTVDEENQGLILANEELKIKMESLENEKGTFKGIEHRLIKEKEELAKRIEEVEEKLSDAVRQNVELVNDRSASGSNGVDISRIQQDFYEIKEKCDSLFVENKNLKAEYAKLEEKCNDFSKVRKKLETQISELEHQYTEIQHEKQLLQDEIQELKISPLNVQANSSKLDQLEILKREEALTTEKPKTPIDKEKFLHEIDILQEKLTQYKSLDLTNKSSIEFYENELQKMKNQNEKLNRKLDETLVTLNHCAELSTSTEVEYLKNVLYNYMLGKESLVLARVIAAVCKFDPEQTETVLQREQQKQTLLGQLGLI